MDVMVNEAAIAAAEHYHRMHYGIPSRPLVRAIGSDYHTLAEELSLEHVGIPMRRPMRSRCENAHKIAH